MAVNFKLCQKFDLFVAANIILGLRLAATKVVLDKYVRRPHANIRFA